ncbi:MAG TPA: hypothetical protein VF843_16930 [Streptosporangiaceae bacterium]
MIVTAALCPGPPLLIGELTGAASVAEDLRSACTDAVGELIAAEPEAIVVVGAAEQTEGWPEAGPLDLAVFAPGPAGPSQAGIKAAANRPTSLGVGGWLLTACGYRGPQILQAVGAAEPADRCARLGAALAKAAGRQALLVVADGSARRTLKAPGYLDERSAGFDESVERCFRTGRLDDLLGLDPALAAELMAAGRPAWQVLAGALAGRAVSSEIRYQGDPFGVAYLVASLRLDPVGTDDGGSGNV